ncbi:hypothetical protein ACHQM5_013592 [Ranunculus cassubicifolius]
MMWATHPIQKRMKNKFKWGEQDDILFQAMEDEFIKQRIHEVDELLPNGIIVTIYNVQLDMICSTPGAEAWVEKLNCSIIRNLEGVVL